MLEKRGAGFVVALIVCVAPLWSGAAPTSTTSEVLKSHNSFSYESNSEGDGTVPGRDRKNGKDPGRGDWPGTGPVKDLPPHPPSGGSVD
jgi:hypothetical protein